jgi:gluconokinase
MKTRFFILMGVSGSGKTTVGRLLADRLGWEFYDGDDFHPPENLAKMSAGIPLTDGDRAPWLADLRGLVSTCLQENRPGVLACSALKERYRQVLTAGRPEVQVVYLRGSYELIRARMDARDGHYMKPAMLRSQFDALEEPGDALVMDISMPVGMIVELILEKDD